MKSLKLDQKTIQLNLDEGQECSVPLTGIISPENATNQNVTWSSSNPNVATVETNGLQATIKAISPGKSKITVQLDDGHKKATCNVFVKDGSEKAKK